MNEPIQQIGDIGLRVADHIEAMLAYWDKDQVCRFANSAYREWFGKSKEELVDKITMKELLGPLYEKNLPYITEALKGNTQQFEREIETPSGELRHSLANYYPDFYDGNVRGFFVHVADISNQKKVEMQLQVANKELEAFSYSVAHDLRAPLRSVHGYAEILNQDYEKLLDDEAKRILENIKHNASKMARLIDDLLAFSRLGRKEMRLSKVSMSVLTQEVIAEINKSLSHKANILVDNLPDVMGDYSLLYQVIVNLISNAIKYSSKKEKPLVQISSEAKNGEIVFSIKDNGVGFDMKYYDKLFGVFQRLHTEREFEGTGVGLAIAHRIIAKHRGKIWAEGKVDVGSTFNFALPVN